MSFLIRNFKSIRNSMIFKLYIITTIVSAAFFMITATNIISTYSKMLYDKERLAGQTAIDSFYSFVYDKYYTIFEMNNLIYSSNSGIDKVLLTIYRDKNYVNSVEASSVINSFARSFSMRDKDIWDFIIIPDKGNAYHYSMYSAEHSVLQSYPYLAYPEIDNLYSGQEKQLTFYDEAPDYIVRKSTPVISFIGKIYDLSQIPNYVPIGAYIVNYRFSTFLNYSSKLLEKFEGNLLIYDESDIIIFSTNKEDIGNNMNLTITNNDNNKIISNRTVGLSGLSVTGVVSEDALFHHANVIRRSHFSLVILAIILNLIISTSLYGYYHKQINVLLSVIKKSDLSIRVPIKSKNEIGLISLTYNHMCNQMQNWIDRQHKTQAQLHAAELQALTLQINPHFIYNTLECIRMQAIMDGNEKVSEMIALFGNMFRWAVRPEEIIVSIDDELDYTTSYLRLQNIRLTNTVDIKIESCDKLLDYGIPKLVLQPLIENAIIHNITSQQDSMRPLSIRISVLQLHKDIKIEINDNGNGIPIDKLTSIVNSLNDPSRPSPATGVGINNVHDRLRLMFGSKYGIEVDSQQYISTTISIVFPMMTVKEMKDYEPTASIC